MKFTYPPESTPLDGFTIKRAIQRGGFGEVYYALSDAGKEVALKLLRHNLEIELRGVKHCLNLKHPNLVTIFDVRTDADDDHWIVMEYVSGKSLAAVIDDAGGPLPPEEIQPWLSGMAAGLSYLHDRGIVHRDFKPANVFLENGIVKIGDVGLSKFISESRRSAQTESVGTVYYMAPEVAHGRYGREVDVYSLAVVLYELLVGRVPFDGESTAEILMKHLTEKPDLSPLPELLRPVLAGALEKDPLKRTQSAALLEEQFNKAIRGIEIPTEIPDESFRKPAHDAPRPAPSSSVDEDPVHAARRQARDAKARAKKAVQEAQEVARDAVRDARREVSFARRQEKKARRDAGRAINRQDGVPVSVQTGPAHTRPARSRRADQAEQSPAVPWVMMVCIGIVLLALFSPRLSLPFIGTVFVFGIYLALAFGAYRLFGLMQAPRPPRIPNSEFRIPKSVLPRHVRALAPETLRAIPLRFRVADLSGAMTYAVLVTAVVVGGFWALNVPLFGDAGAAGLFAITTLLGAWAVLVPSKLWEGSRTGSHTRRYLQIAAGCMVGLAAWWLHQTLMVDVGGEAWIAEGGSGSLFATVGSGDLVSRGGQPSLAGYLIFFSILFGVRRWWRHTDAFRRKRFRVGTLLLTGLAGFVLPLIFAFPHLWGLMWALSISIVVQLSASWVPPAERVRLLQRRADAA